MITQERLKEFVNYDPETGVFTSKKPHPRRAIGSRLGCPNKAGYLRLTIEYVPYYLHRLAYLYMTGEWPPEVDHINRIRDDNRWANLRWADRSVNMRNLPPRTGKVAPKWVSRCTDGAWQARVLNYRTGKKAYLGRFKTVEDASKAVDSYVSSQ